MKRMQGKKGFTLIELIVVILILGILAAIGIFAYNGVQDSARKADVNAATTQVAKALSAEAVATEKAGATATIEALLKDPVVDEIAKFATELPGYTVAASTDSKSVTVKKAGWTGTIDTTATIAKVTGVAKG